MTDANGDGLATAHVALAVTRARGAQPGWSRLPIRERGRALRKLAARARADGELAQLIATETGKPLFEAIGFELAYLCEVTRFLTGCAGRRALGESRRTSLIFPHKRARVTWQPRGVVVLAMQSLDNALALVRKRRWLLGRNLSARRAAGAPPIPTYLPLANQAAEFVALRMDGFALNAINEVLLGVPITAHILGGARMAESPGEGVVDEACRVFGHPGVWVVDGAAIPTNLGANPSLTIAAVAEHAMSLIPAKEKAGIEMMLWSWRSATKPARTHPNQVEDPG